MDSWPEHDEEGGESHGGDQDAPESPAPAAAAPDSPLVDDDRVIAPDAAMQELRPDVPATTVQSPVADGEFHQLDPNYVRVERISSGITTAVLAAGISLGLILQWIFDWFEGWIEVAVIAGAVAFLALMVWLTVVWPLLVYRATSYRVSELGIEIRRGVVWKAVIDVPKSRIQHTDVQQGPLQRKFRIATIMLHTAGTTNASVQLAGLNYDRALAIRDFLIRSAHVDAV